MNSAEEISGNTRTATRSAAQEEAKQRQRDEITPTAPRSYHEAPHLHIVLRRTRSPRAKATAEPAHLLRTGNTCTKSRRSGTACTSI